MADRQGLFDGEVDFLREASTRRSPTRRRGPKSGGVGWAEHRAEDLVELVPPRRPAARLRFLPQSYLAQRRVREKLLLATTPEVGKESLRRARRDRTGRPDHAVAAGALPLARCTRCSTGPSTGR